MKIDPKPAASKELPGNNAGFSILEIVVAMVIFAVVTGAVWGVLRVAGASRGVVSQQVALAKSVRLGLNLIGRDTYNAGFGYPLRNTVVSPDNRISTLLGIPVDVDTSRDTVPPIIAGNNITLNTFNSASNIRTDQVTFLFKDNTFNLVGSGSSAVSTPLNINAATTNGSGIDELVPISGSNAACRVNDIYLISGNTGSTIGLATALSGTNIIQFSNGDVLGLNQTGTSGPLRSITVPASITRVIMVTYFVTADGTLTRREYANVPPATPAVAYADEPLVYGIENFQIQYVMDDGSLTDNPSAGPDGIAGNADDTQSNLAAVRQIRFTISAKSVDLNSSGQPYKETMTSTFATRNLGYDAN
jgi:prepilin-type N-terminal cleavage/methylation domain-containing protein